MTVYSKKRYDNYTEHEAKESDNNENGDKEIEKKNRKENDDE